MPFLRRFAPVVFCLVALFAAAGAHANELNETLEKARGFLGRDRDLDGLRSVRFAGTIADDSGGSGKIEIIFQKPLFHRITIEVDGATDTKALDDYEGWTYAKNADSQWSFRILDSSEVARLRSIVWENLNFFRGVERLGGRVEFKGRQRVDNIDCVQVDFIHSRDVFFSRFFERSTGRLVLTRTDMRTEVREEGEIRAQGIRFPQRVITTSEMEVPGESGEGPKTVKRTTTITFETIEVNRTFERSMFLTPLFTALP